jgi:hypothetical protein
MTPNHKPASALPPLSVIFTSLVCWALLVAVLVLLSGCASMTSGTTQSVLVESTPRGARCELANDKGNWTVAETPASASVARSYSALTIACQKGKLSGSASAESTTQGSAFGNILLGGIVGAAVDMSSGAAYGYPATVHVALSAGDGR